MSDLTVTYTTWVGLNAKSLSRTVTEPWAKFVEKFSQKRPYRGQWNHPGWSGATFSKSHRCDENVTSITMLVLDFDHDYRIDDARRDFAGLIGLLHTSKSHTDNEHAFRVILPLSRPVTAEEYAELWAWAEWKSGAKLDIACKDASRFWYQPGVLSDDSTFVAEELTGDVLAVDEIIAGWLANPGRVVVPEAAEPAETKPKSAPRATAGTSDYRGRGILFAAFENRNWIRKEIDSDKCAAVCPWESSHTAGKGSESSTVLYFAKPGHEIGYLHCSHAHCAGRTADDVLGLFSQDELDEARRVEGLPAFRAPKANVRELVPPPDDGWHPTDDDDPRAPPKARAMAAALASVVGLTPEDFPSSTSNDVPESFDRKRPMPQVDPHKYALTDLGNSERFVRDHGEILRYCRPKKKWYVWTGKHWQQDETGEVIALAKATVRSIYAEADACTDEDRRKAIAKHAVKSENGARISEIANLSQTVREIAILPQQLDADPWLFCAANGTIDLRTGALLGHRQQDLISRISPVEYDPAAKSEIWYNYLKAATNGDTELAAYLQRAVGYALQGTVTEKKFFFLYGPADGGKSTFINAIAGVFGPYHEATSAETWLTQTFNGGNRGDLVRIIGSRLATAIEFRKGAKFDESLIKKITGGDAMAYAKKYEDEVSFTATFALWFAANDPPAIRDDDLGMWARVQRIPFTSVVPESVKDERLGEKLRDPKVQSAILKWAVDGCMLWQSQRLGTCAAVEKSNAEYRSEMDRAAGFLDEECVLAPNTYVLVSKLRDAYEAWCKQNSVSPLSGKDMAARLENKGAVAGKHSGHRCWNNVRLVEGLFDGPTKDSRTAGTAVLGNPATFRSREDFPTNDVHGVQMSSRDEAEDAEYQAEFSWRGGQS